MDGVVCRGISRRGGRRILAVVMLIINRWSKRGIVQRLALEQTIWRGGHWSGGAARRGELRACEAGKLQTTYRHTQVASRVIARQPKREVLGIPSYRKNFFVRNPAQQNMDTPTM